MLLLLQSRQLAAKKKKKQSIPSPFRALSMYIRQERLASKSTLGSWDPSPYVDLKNTLVSLAFFLAQCLLCSRKVSSCPIHVFCLYFLHRNPSRFLNIQPVLDNWWQGKEWALPFLPQCAGPKWASESASFRTLNPPFFFLYFFLRLQDFHVISRDFTRRSSCFGLVLTPFNERNFPHCCRKAASVLPLETNPTTLAPTLSWSRVL